MDWISQGNGSQNKELVFKQLKLGDEIDQRDKVSIQNIFKIISVEKHQLEPGDVSILEFGDYFELSIPYPLSQLKEKNIGFTFAELSLIKQFNPVVVSDINLSFDETNIKLTVKILKLSKNIKYYVRDITIIKSFIETENANLVEVTESATKKRKQN
jgi:hypothetical protein